MNPLNYIFRTALGLLLVCATVTTHAKVKPATIFDDNMVLQQQQKNLPLWGTATPNKQVNITTSWDKRTYATTTNSEGKWKATLSTPTAGGPYAITFNDGAVTTLKNILIGEVWICSGQSNMEMPMKGFPGQALEKETNMDVLCSANPQIRLFNVKHNTTLTPQGNVDGEWQVATPATVVNFSAVAYYFGRLLQQNLNVPIGLITSHWGASSQEAWMSREMLADFPNIPLPRTNDDIKEKQRTPSTLYNGMIYPLKGLGMRGMIWYQGESNIERIPQYSALLEKFITSLRKDWNIGAFPFYYCQVAPYSYYKTNSALLREAQMEVEQHVPNTGMAVLMDAGLKGGIHPQKKKTAGERLALQALVGTYGMVGPTAQSPLYKSMKVQNDTVVLSFDRVPMGLSSFYQPMKQFTLAGDDHTFCPAKAWIKINQVYLVSDKVKKPVAARYAFENWAEAELFSVNGLPVSSFRTDRFDESTSE